MFSRIILGVIMIMTTCLHRISGTTTIAVGIYSIFPTVATGISALLLLLLQQRTVMVRRGIKKCWLLVTVMRIMTL